jgi:type IV pilus assembly protein PilV
MMKMHKKFFKKTVSSSKGFSLLEVLLGITVFMIGMLGVTALNISSLKSSTFAGNMSEAVIIAGDRIEKLMALDFDTDLIDPDGDGTNQDDDDDGLDDDHPDDAATDIDGKPNFGLDDTGADADGSDLAIGKNGMYDVYWNVAVGEPLTDKTKTVNVIVEWDIKGNIRSMNMSTIIMNHD